MAKLERIKEELAYLRLWLGILAVTVFGLAGWIATHFEKTSAVVLVGGCVAFVITATGCLDLHRQILRKLAALKET